MATYTNTAPAAARAAHAAAAALAAPTACYGCGHPCTTTYSHRVQATAYLRAWCPRCGTGTTVRVHALP